MERFQSDKTDVNINNLPSYEINHFLNSILIQEDQKQKNDVSKIDTDKVKNVANLPPNCEIVRISKDNINEQ